mgnify:CR=1 FL=1
MSEHGVTLPGLASQKPIENLPFMSFWEDYIVSTIWHSKSCHWLSVLPRSTPWYYMPKALLLSEGLQKDTKNVTCCLLFWTLYFYQPLTTSYYLSRSWIYYIFMYLIPGSNSKKWWEAWWFASSLTTHVWLNVMGVYPPHLTNKCIRIFMRALRFNNWK